MSTQSEGTVRRLDVLGRICIPRQYRDKLKFVEQEPLEIKLVDDTIVIRKAKRSYDVLEDIFRLFKLTTGCTPFLTDTDGNLLFPNWNDVFIYEYNKYNRLPAENHVQETIMDSNGLVIAFLNICRTEKLHDYIKYLATIIKNNID